MALSLRNSVKGAVERSSRGCAGSFPRHSHTASPITVTGGVDLGVITRSNQIAGTIRIGIVDQGEVALWYCRRKALGKV